MNIPSADELRRIQSDNLSEKVKKELTEISAKIQKQMIQGDSRSITVDLWIADRTKKILEEKGYKVKCDSSMRNESWTTISL